MDANIAENKEICPRGEIASYLDGELSPAAEISLEKHFAGCPACLSELNLQKKMLSVLDCAFDEKEEIALPGNFARIVATNAESHVSGLRSKKERPLAVFLCTGMILLALLGFGTESAKVLAAFVNFTDQFAAVTGFVLHSIYGFFVGVSVIIKYSSQQIIYGSVTSLLGVTGLFFASFVALSKLVRRTNTKDF